MKKSNIFILLLIVMQFLLAPGGNAQLAQYHIGGPKNEMATKILKVPGTTDGSVIIAGYTYDLSGISNQVANAQAIIMKVNNTGIVWQKTFGTATETNNVVRDMIFTHDGNIVVVGSVGYSDVYSNNHAAILKFRTTDGLLMWQNCFRDINTADMGGETFNGVTELGSAANYRLVAVGCHNFTGNTSDGMITVFNATGAYLRSDVLSIIDNDGYNNGDEFNAVVTAANGTDIYTCGEYATHWATAKNGRYMQYTPGTSTIPGAIVWDKYVDFTLPLGTLGGESNNFMSRIYLQDGKLIIFGGCLNYYSITSGAGNYVMKVDPSNGNVINLHELRNSGRPYTNDPAIALKDADHIYTVETPANTWISSSNWTIGTVSEAVVTDITSLDGMTANPPVRFNATAGIHSILDLKYNSGYLYMAGATNDVTYGNNDIYYVLTSTTGTPFASLTKEKSCDTAQDNIAMTEVTVTDVPNVQHASTFTPTPIFVDTATTTFKFKQICGDNFGPCYDSGKLVITQLPTLPGEPCKYQAVVTVHTGNIIYGYGWYDAGSSTLLQLDHTSANSDTYIFTTTGTMNLLVKAYIVNPNFAPGNTPCCEADFSQSVTCQTKERPCTCFIPGISTINAVYTGPGAFGNCCNFLITATAGIGDNCHVVGYKWETNPTNWTSATSDNYNACVSPMISRLVNVTIYAVDFLTGDTCKFDTSIGITCPNLESNPCDCFDPATTTLTDVYLGPGLRPGYCNFQLNVVTGLKSPCQVVGYQLNSNPPFWSTSTTTSFIVSISSMISVIENVTIIAINPITGDTCRYAMHVGITCPGGIGRKPGHASGTDANGNTVGQGIDIFPNPTEDAVTVQANGMEIATIQVINVNGQKVGDYTYSQTTSAVITLDKLPAGTYLFRINDTISKIVTKK